MPKKKTTAPLEPEISEFASLKQAVEWVAFGQPPLAEPCEELRPKDSIWLRNRDPDSSIVQAICSAQMELFTALRKGALTATAYDAEEIKISNYDKDSPYFQPAVPPPKKKRPIFKPQQVNKSSWDYDSIFWTDSSLIYDRRNLSSNMWLLAKHLHIETSKLFELFPKKGGSLGKEPAQKNIQEPLNPITHTGDPGRPTSAHLYLQEFERRLKAKNIEVTLAEQARVLHNWFTSKWSTPNLESMQ